MMELAIRRFDFGQLQDFAAPPPPIEIANDHTLPEAEEFTPPPPPSFSEEELEAAKALAFAEGKQAGINEEAARKAADAQANEHAAHAASHTLLQHVQAMQADWAHFKATETEELGALLMLMVRKVAGDALANAPEEAVKAMIQDCLGVLQREPKIVAQVHPAIFTPIEAMLRQIAEQYHLENTITLKSNESLQPGEATLDWEQGRAARDLNAIWAQIETMIAEMDFSKLASASAPAQAAPQESSSSEATNEEQPQQGESNE